MPEKKNRMTSERLFIAAKLEVFMSVLQSILSAGNGGVLNQLTSRFGINAEQATSAVSALVPTLAGGIKERIANNDIGLANLLTGEKMKQFARDVPNLGSPAAADVGKSLVAGIFSSDETSKIISTIAEKVGIGGDTVTKMLPIVATLVGGFISKSAASGGNLTETLGQLSEVGQGGFLGAVKGLTSKVFG